MIVPLLGVRERTRHDLSRFHGEEGRIVVPATVVVIANNTRKDPVVGHVLGRLIETGRHVERYRLVI